MVTSTYGTIEPCTFALKAFSQPITLEDKRQKETIQGRSAAHLQNLDRPWMNTIRVPDSNRYVPVPRNCSSVVVIETGHALFVDNTNANAGMNECIGTHKPGWASADDEDVDKIL